jgi:hypothetical protein
MVSSSQFPCGSTATIACAPFFFVRRRYVGGPHDRRIDRHIFIIVIAGQHFENAFKTPLLAHRLKRV